MKTKVIAILLIATGGVLFVYGIHLVAMRFAPVDFTRTTSNIYLPSQPNYPTILEIPSLNLKLPISLATIKDGKWDNPEHSVAYWIDSPIPGAKGNSVFYGHNWPTIFGKLNKVQVGDELKITLADSSIKTFTIKTKNTVGADQTHILKQTDDTRVTLYTCTGFLDLRRLVVVAIPE